MRSLRLPCRARRQRGSLLIEAMISTAIMAVVLASTLQLIANGRMRLGKASNPEIASALARSKAEQLVGASHVISAETAETAVPGHPGFYWRWEEAGALPGFPSAMFRTSDTIHEVRVWVRYPTELGPRTHFYSKLKRKLR